MHGLECSRNVVVDTGCGIVAIRGRLNTLARIVVVWRYKGTRQSATVGLISERAGGGLAVRDSLREPGSLQGVYWPQVRYH